MLRRINANARRVMELIDDAVWAINPGNDSLDDLLLRMRSFADEVL
ncbi:MAG: two-component sensor histidine kinase, partial [Ignavibacteria bacterium]